MSKPISAKTALAQVIGIGLAGTAVTTEALAQENTASLRVSLYDLNLDFNNLSQAKYTNGTGGADASDVTRLDLTVPVNEKWDARFSVKNMQADGNVGGYTYVNMPISYSVNTSLALDSQVIDFEAGYHLKLGEQDVRVFGGLRYMDLKSSASQGFSFAYFGGSYSYSIAATVSRESELKAYGLRAGAESSIALGKGFSANGLVAVSAIRGDRENEIRYASNFGYSGQYPANDDSDTWLGSEAEVSITWDASPQTAGGALLSVGYTWSQTQDILSTSVDSIDSEESDLTEQGVFGRIEFVL